MSKMFDVALWAPFCQRLICRQKKLMLMVFV